MKKITLKTISCVIAVVMLFSMVPFAASAKPLTAREIDFSGLDLLLALDHLGDTEGAGDYEDVTYPNGSPYKQTTAADALTANGNLVSAGTTTAGSWISYVARTDLPLTDSSKYTLQFDSQVLTAATYSHVEFSFSTASLTAGGDPMSWAFGGGSTAPNSVFIAKGHDSMDKYIYKDPAGSYPLSSLTTKATYTMFIDGTNLSFYVGVTHIYTVDISQVNSGTAGFVHNQLALGMRIRTTQASNGQEVMSMTNIKVYDGLATVNEGKNNFKDGDILLQVPNLNNAASATSEFDDVSVTQKAMQNLKTGDDPNAVYLTNPSAAAWTMSGVNTNLPLNAGSKYTIEFYAQNNTYNNTQSNFGFCFAGAANNNAMGVYFYPNSVNTVYGYSTSLYNASNPTFSNIWTKYKDNAGWTRFSIEINGYDVTSYIGGVKGPTINFEAKLPSATPSASTPYTDGFSSAFLTLGIKNYMDIDRTAAVGTGAIYSVKNVTVYAGNIETLNKVEFMDGGAVVETKKGEIGTIINEFPEVTAPEGKVPVWFYKGTNVVVTAPYEVVHDVVLEVRYMLESLSSVIGIQHTAPSSNMQSVRFIAGIHSLKASGAGFEITSVYLDGETVKTKEHEKRCTVVYSSINATANGTVTSVKATDLGATYMFALSLDKVSTNIGQIDFYVRSYVIVDGAKIYGETVTVTMNNGAVTTSLPLLVIPS